MKILKSEIIMFIEVETIIILLQKYKRANILKLQFQGGLSISNGNGLFVTLTNRKLQICHGAS